ncbi:MAG TPA: ABC transporter ATP-binding protein [Xanthobacteraceae bacterium]|nr:ABC transporter ATP-binding protein [Xanthobacteraceae bacterium]
MSAIACEHLTIALGERTILADVSLTIEEGEFVGVLGPNGSGKTTLMRAVLGMIPITGGDIRVLDAPVRRGNPAIGYAPQVRSPLLNSRLRGWDFVASVVDGHRWGLPWRSAADRDDVARALALVGAERLAYRPISELSGGERQRLLIAQALVGKPRLLLLDEPLISLDPPRQQAVIDMVRDIAGRLELTVLFSAHEVNPLLGALDRVLYLGNRQAALGPVEEVITAPVLSRLYGAEIDVIHLHGRIFVMSRGHDLEHDAHQHENGHGTGHGHAH